MQRARLWLKGDKPLDLKTAHETAQRHGDRKQKRYRQNKSWLTTAFNKTKKHTTKRINAAVSSAPMWLHTRLWVVVTYHWENAVPCRAAKQKCHWHKWASQSSQPRRPLVLSSPDILIILITTFTCKNSGTRPQSRTCTARWAAGVGLNDILRSLHLSFRQHPACKTSPEPHETGMK